MSDFILSAFADEAGDSLAEQVEAIKRNGISQIEIRNVDGKCVIDLSEDELHSIKKTINEKGVKISAIGSPIGKYSIEEPFEPHFKRFQKAVQAAKILDTQRIRVFSFFIPKDKNPADYQIEVLRRLDMLVNYAKQYGVWCCHENEKEIFGDVAERCLELHEANGMLKGIFDPANFIQCHNVPKEIFPKLAKYIDYIHIKDAQLLDGSVVPSGKGDGAIAEILAQFCQRGKNQLLTVEPHLAVFSGLDQLQDDEIKHKYTYATQGEAFDAAVNALKEILDQGGYSYE